MEQILKRRGRANINYMTTKTIEPIFNQYRQNTYEQSYILPKLPGYEAKFLHGYQRPPAVRTMAGSYIVYRMEAQRQYKMPRIRYRADRYLSLTATMQAFTKNDHREKADDWARFFYHPVIIYSNGHNKIETKESQKLRYELVELKNTGSHRKFLIRDIVMSRLVRWEDFPDINTVAGYLKKYGFPEDKCYSKEQFLNDVENENEEVFICVAKQKTAEFILSLCCALIDRPI